MVENICEKKEKHRCTQEKGKRKKKLANINTIKHKKSLFFTITVDPMGKNTKYRLISSCNP
jgi:hypothetical protein